MITGKIRYLVAEVSCGGDTTYWGPFPDEETAEQWEGLPGVTGRHTYVVQELRSAPQWFPGFSPEEETEGGDPTDG